MTADVMVFLTAVSVLAGAAAWTADAGLRRLGRPSRWVWLTALLAPGVLLALGMAGMLAPSGAGSAGALGALGAVPVVEIPGLRVGAAVSSWAGLLGTALGGLWAAGTLGVLVALVRAHRTLAADRGGWAEVGLMGHDVLVSENRGPAVAGLLRGWVVLPRWVLTLPEAELRMVLEHEAEHLRARDPLLLAAGLGAVLLTPWNPVTWWQLRRLRTAMEVDCDRRVLARHPDPRTYGSSLLTVAERASGPTLALAAFSERSTSLEERIVTMTRPTSSRSKLLGAALLVLAVVVGVQACGVESPVSPGDVAPPSGVQLIEPEGMPDDPPEPQPRSPEEMAAEPTFTPFTVAPSITNRMEVIAAMAENYPPLLREAGIGGAVRVYFFIGADGVVRDVRIDRSSGHEALDQAALRVADVYEFSPARNGDEPVPVWVSFPITFQIR